MLFRSIPELLRDKELQVITLDRNNQLEVLSSSNNGNYIQFSTNHFSTFSIYPTGNKLNVDGTKDLSPNTGDNIHPKWFLGFGLFFAGISLILFQKIYKDKKLIQ